MIKEMKGWKVMENGSRMSADVRTWARARRHQKWLLTYPVGVEVKPKVQGSKLFFFKNKNDAFRFASLSTDIIVPCIAKNAVRVKWASTDTDNLELFWKQRRKACRRMCTPEGTWLAESITCLR